MTYSKAYPILSILFYGALTSAPLSGAEAGDDSFPEADIEMRFNYGDSCARLDFMSAEAIAGLLLPENSAHWSRFCYAEDYIDCDAYSEIVDEYGFLVINLDSEYCMYIPRDL